MRLDPSSLPCGVMLLLQVSCDVWSTACKHCLNGPGYTGNVHNTPQMWGPNQLKDRKRLLSQTFWTAWMEAGYLHIGLFPALADHTMCLLPWHFLKLIIVCI